MNLTCKRWSEPRRSGSDKVTAFEFDNCRRVTDRNLNVRMIEELGVGENRFTFYKRTAHCVVGVLHNGFRMAKSRVDDRAIEPMQIRTKASRRRHANSRDSRKRTRWKKPCGLQRGDGKGSVAVALDPDGGEVGAAATRRSALLLDVSGEPVKRRVPHDLDWFSATHAAGYHHCAHIALRLLAEYYIKFSLPNFRTPSLSHSTIPPFPYFHILTLHSPALDFTTERTDASGVIHEN